MQIIPVIDLKEGHAVHARQGLRECYQPIRSVLCPDSAPGAVLDSILELYPFPTIYIADLDAISGGGNHDTQISKLLTRYPQVTFWIDRGCQSSSTEPDLPSNYIPVIGSESLDREKQTLLTDLSRPFVLSLDFSATGPKGPDYIFNQPECWPENVIIMTLSRVGSNDGPDRAKLMHYKNSYPGYNFIAAGGISNRADLEHLSAMGFNQALLASALHSRAIGNTDILELWQISSN